MKGCLEVYRDEDRCLERCFRCYTNFLVNGKLITLKIHHCLSLDYHWLPLKTTHLVDEKKELGSL